MYTSSDGIWSCFLEYYTRKVFFRSEASLWTSLLLLNPSNTHTKYSLTYLIQGVTVFFILANGSTA